MARVRCTAAKRLAIASRTCGSEAACRVGKGKHMPTPFSKGRTFKKGWQTQGRGEHCVQDELIQRCL
eukprot:1158463-Pelagomonas_calceolata.AAC.1